MFNYENNFQLANKLLFKKWINAIIFSEGRSVGDINFIFCDDDYLLKINQKYLNHDTLTDIVSFDYSDVNTISGDVFISTERVLENANSYKISFENELLRVMAHGILHYCGYKDKNASDAKFMRAKEDEKINLFHVEQMRININ